MEMDKLDDTRLLAIIGLLVSVLIAVLVLFGIAWLNDIKHSDPVDVQSCYRKNL
ncbi:hypothetical protein [Biostraticola tofi]|uniref:Uncharacterized protein n=1 Tax=Biostraticola tofi TaxID=466109 RepID=A0A4R3Z306_9GAMM|nr:hypothetical protein [Biostraticola tofi]TCV98223.1 hypothetical protein EDC52_103314 [Biostraticola tofi]